MMPHPDLIKIYPYSSAWPEWFAAEREVLEVVFSSANVQIEHIGSTAVPGLGAKPNIDILLGAPSLPVIEAKIPALLTLELTRQSFSKSIGTKLSESCSRYRQRIRTLLPTLIKGVWIPGSQ
jgi:GrpB-like predicted nucleotidyltransferase (UPF0157 family)